MGDLATLPTFQAAPTGYSHTDFNAVFAALTIANGAVSTNKLADNAVTFQKMATVATQTLLGRSTAGTGQVESLTLGAGLVLAATVLSVGWLDTNSSHRMGIACGSDLTADRTITITPGDAARTITLSGNPTLADWFDQSVKSGTAPTFVATNFSGTSGITGTGALTAGSINWSGNIATTGTGSFGALTATVADAAVAARFAGATGRLRIYGYDGSGSFIDAVNTAENAYRPLVLGGSTVTLSVPTTGNILAASASGVVVTGSGTFSSNVIVQGANDLRLNNASNNAHAQLYNPGGSGVYQMAVRLNGTDRALFTETGLAVTGTTTSSGRITSTGTGLMHHLSNASAVTGVYSRWDFNNIVVGYIGTLDQLVGGGAATSFGIDGVNNVTIAVADTQRAVFNTTGFSVTGTGSFTGECSAASFNATSARRYKKNIVDLTGAVELVMRFRPVRYDNLTGKRDLVGFIAEDMDKILPSLVARDPEGLVTGLNYAPLVAPLTGAVQDHERRLRTLEAMRN